MAIRSLAPWWGWVLVAAGVIAAMPARSEERFVPAQATVPAAPPGGGDGKKNAPGEGGVIRPPVSAGDQSRVIQPPMTGSMPVITPAPGAK